jgi:hypothetical protein
MASATADEFDCVLARFPEQEDNRLTLRTSNPRLNRALAMGAEETGTEKIPERLPNEFMVKSLPNWNRTQLSEY